MYSTYEDFELTKKLSDDPSAPRDSLSRDSLSRDSLSRDNLSIRDNNKLYNKTPVVTSYGLICCSFPIKDEPLSVLMVRKKNTYAYLDFVRGCYSPYNNQAMIDMFSKMTADEKITIRSLAFEFIWSRAWHSVQHRRQLYFRSKARFEKSFLYDGGVRLINLIDRSHNARDIWEVPKGKKEGREDDIECAVREFREETGLQKNKYTIMPHKQYRYEFEDEGIKYIFVYYLAILKSNINKMIPIKPETTCEITECRWMNILEIRVMANHKLAAFLKPIIKTAKKR